MNKDKMEDFLAELSELTKKHKIAIGGLGIDSPYLFFPLYAGRDDCYRADRSGNNLVWTGDTIHERSEIKAIKQSAIKKTTRVVEFKQASGE